MSIITRSGRVARAAPPSSPSESLEDLLRRTLAQASGSNSGRLENITWNPEDRSLDLDSWLLQVEQSFRVHAPDKTSAERTDWAILQLRGRAAKWWSAMTFLGEREAMFNASNPWEIFCAAIKKEFKPLDATQFARDKLWTLTQRTTVQQFVDQLRLVARDIPGMLQNDGEMKDRLYRGLKPEIATVVRQAAPDTFERAVEIANAYCQATRQVHHATQRYVPFYPPRIPRPFRPRSRGPYTPGPSISHKRSSYIPSKFRRPRAIHQRAFPQRRPLSNVTCYKCGKTGHYANNCRADSIGLNQIIAPTSPLALEALDDDVPQRRNWFPTNTGE